MNITQPNSAEGRSAGRGRPLQQVRSQRPARPLLETGPASERRILRQRRAAAKARRNRTITIGIAAITLFALALSWRHTSDDEASGTPTLQRASARAVEIIRAADPVVDPTPILASRGNVILRLPVAVDDLTEVGFHQASYDYALSMETPLPDADMESVKAKKSSARDKSLQQAGPDAVLTGSVLRMWRDRPGKPDSALDVGAAPGSTVFAPVEGTVVLVKPYDLYGKYPDVQIHVRPDANAKIDCVLIHVADPVVKAGDHVSAGVTPIGAVRKLADRMNMQLGHYTPEGGNHVHVQLNDLNDPLYEGLKGAPDTSGS